MKNFFNRMLLNAQSCAFAVRAKLQEKKGNFVMEHGVVFIIIIALASVAIVALVAYMQSDLSSLLKLKVSELFN